MKKNNIISNYWKRVPQAKKDRTQAFITLLLTLIAVSFLALFAIMPTLSTITELNKELADNKIVYEKLQEKIANLNILQQRYAQIEPDIPVILSAIPLSPQVPLLVGQIQTIGAKALVKLTRIQVFRVELSPSKTTQIPDSYGTFSFALSAEGSYDDIITFLTTLSNFERIISIESYTLSKGNAGTIVQLTVEGKAYFKP